jgi:hypothetical protein
MDFAYLSFKIEWVARTIRMLIDLVMSRMILPFLIIGFLAGCAGHDASRSSTPSASDGVVWIGGPEVHRQGTYPWHSGMTVQDAIRAAGALSEFGKHSRIRVTQTDGTRDTFKYALILPGKTKDPAL